MEKNVIKIKFNTLITIIVISILILGGITALILCKRSKDTNNKEKFIKIRYAYIYNVTHADALNKNGEHIDILEINLRGEKLEKIYRLLKKQSYRKIKNLQLLVLDMYEVNINDEIKLSINPGENYAYYTKGEESFLIEISKELVNEIDKIVQEEASKNIKQFSSEKITIISRNNKQVTITDKEHIKQLNEYSKYIKVNVSKDLLKDEEISHVVDLNDGTKIYIYFKYGFGLIIDKNGNKYNVAFTEHYEDIVNIMFENYKSI